MVTIRNHSHTCADAAFTSRGYYSRAAFISFKSFGLCGYYLRAATIRGQRLFEEIRYIPSIVETTISLCPQNLHTWEPGNETTTSISFRLQDLESGNETITSISLVPRIFI